MLYNILIVDDNEDICNVISDALKEEGCTVTITHNGMDAIKEVSNKQYDSVVLDYRLLEKDGLEVLQEIRKIAPSLAVVMISAYGNEYIKAKARELGVYQFFDKPFDLQNLVSTVKRAVKG